MTQNRHIMRRMIVACGIAMSLQVAAFAQEGEVQQGRFVDENAPRAISELFAPAADLVPMVPNEVGCVTVRTITLDSARLAKLVAGDGVMLSPEPNVSELWTVDEAVQKAPNVRVVRMSMPNDPTALATFVTYDDATAMTMHIPSQKRLYRLHFGGNDKYHVWKMNAAQMPLEGDVHVHDGDVVPDPEREPGDDDWSPEGFGERDAGGCAGSNRVMDVWLLYTVTARDSLGGTSACRAECALAVEHANTAYIASAMSTRMRLVACTETSYDESATNQDIDLDRLTTTNDGWIDSVHTTRDTYNADLVHMVTDNGSGLGWCPGGAPGYSNGFSVSRWTRVAATYTLAHETGHNLGAGHDVANGGACGPSYGVGRRFFGTDSNGYCTVLAYPDATYERVLRFSNPNINYQGTPTGVAIGSAGEAYNARVITDNDNTVEGHELTRFDIYVDFGFSGFPAEIGTAAFPYNTLPEGVAAIDTPNTGSGESPTMYIDAGSTNYTGTISKVMTIVPCSGSVRIGPL